MILQKLKLITSTLTICSALTVALLTSGPASAARPDMNTSMATVVEVNQRLRNIVETRPEQQCTTREVPTIVESDSGSTAGTIIGGVAGGIIGNQVGKGSGRDLATGIGVITGAVVGSELTKKQSIQTQVVRDCKTIQVSTNRVIHDGHFVTVRVDRTGDLHAVIWPVGRSIPTVGDRVNVIIEYVVMH